jgi:serine/threonine protein kinase
MTGSTSAALHLILLALKLRFLDETHAVQAYDAILHASDSKSPSEILIDAGLLSGKQIEILEPLVRFQKEHAPLSVLGSTAADLGPSDGAAFAATQAESQASANPTEVRATSIYGDANANIPTADEFESTGTSSGVSPSGRFHKLGCHDRGGLGVIYRADDAELHRIVALKEIRADRAEIAEFRALFMREAEITGRLEHPGIVPVYSFGHYPNGRPYYAMRFIEGSSLRDQIAQFHDKPCPPGTPKRKNPLSWQNEAFRALLIRFIRACDPLAFAHARGVVHRDMKPEHIMLGPFGETLVVDWGLARCAGRDSNLDDDPDPASPHQSRLALELRGIDSAEAATHGRMVGTPQFLAPEQAARRSDLIGPWSDIYSMGATLYTLLCGRPPFDFRTAELAAALAEWDRSIRPTLPADDQDAARSRFKALWLQTDRDRILEDVQAGRFSHPRQVNPSVPEALEQVCLKAMAVSPPARYARIADLASDLSQWLADQPVSVHSDPISVRLTRWGRRNRGKAAAAAMLMVTALLGLGISALALSVHNSQIALARDRAQNSLAVASQTASNSLDVFDDADFGMFHPSKAYTLLHEARTSYEAILHEDPAHPGVLAELADIQRHMANLGRSLGYYDSIGDVFAQVRPGATDPAARSAQPPRSLYHESIDMALRHLARFPDDQLARVVLARAYSDLGDLERQHGRPTETRRAYVQALRSAKALPPSNAWAQIVPAQTQIGLGRLDLTQGHADLALAAADEALQLLPDPIQLDPTDRSVEPIRIAAVTLRALALNQLGQSSDALAEAHRASQLAVAFEKDDQQSQRSKETLARTFLDVTPLTWTSDPSEQKDAIVALNEVAKRCRAMSQVNRYYIVPTELLIHTLTERARWLNAASPETHRLLAMPTLTPQACIDEARSLINQIPTDREPRRQIRCDESRLFAIEADLAQRRSESVEAAQLYKKAIDSLRATIPLDQEPTSEEARWLQEWESSRKALSLDPTPSL